MAKVFCIIAILLISFFNLSSSVNITCSYSNRSFWVIGTLYTCTITNNPLIDSPNKAQIDSVTGVQLAGKTLDSETTFFSDKTVQYIPQGLEKIYKNFVGLYIWGGRLKEIHQSDLKFYTKLRVIDLGQNDIDILEEGLFDFNPNLEVISFANNKIFHVALRVFEGLVKLGSINLDDNPCSNFYVERNLVGIQNSVSNLKNTCTSQTFLDLDDEIENLEEHSENLTRENFLNFEVRFINFENEFRKEKFLRFLPLIRRYQFLSNLNIEDLPETCKKCCQLDDFQSQNLEFFKSITNLIVNLQKAQDDSFSLLSSKIFQIDGKISRIDDKIGSLAQNLANLTDNFNNFVRNLNDFEAYSVTKFANIEDHVEQAISQITNSILSSLDVKIRDLETRLVNRIKSNLGDN